MVTGSLRFHSDERLDLAAIRMCKLPLPSVRLAMFIIGCHRAKQFVFLNCRRDSPNGFATLGHYPCLLLHLPRYLLIPFCHFTVMTLTGS
jgi:hypothetical protein